MRSQIQFEEHSSYTPPENGKRSQFDIGTVVTVVIMVIGAVAIAGAFMILIFSEEPHVP